MSLSFSLPTKQPEDARWNEKTGYELQDSGAAPAWQLGQLHLLKASGVAGAADELGWKWVSV